MIHTEFFQNLNLDFENQLLYKKKIQIDDKDIKKLTNLELEKISLQIKKALENTNIPCTDEEKEIREDNLVRIYNQIDKEIIMRRLENSVNQTKIHDYEKKKKDSNCCCTLI